MRLSGVDTPAYLISDDADIDNGRTIVWRKYKVLEQGNTKVVESDLMPPDPGAPCGLVSINVQCSDGVAEIVWTFRSEWGQPVYDLQGSTSQEPITSHPRYKDLYEKYAITERNGEPVWMEKDPDGTSQATGLSTSGDVVSGISPLYGVRDYLAAQAVYRYTQFYTDRASIPQDLVSKVGKIDIPTNLQNPGPTGRWLRCGASIRQVGDAFQVTISWMCSQSSRPEGLWKSEIYA
jgi:hypothetical protein